MHLSSNRRRLASALACGLLLGVAKASAQGIPDAQSSEQTPPEEPSSAPSTAPIAPTPDTPSRTPATAPAATTPATVEPPRDLPAPRDIIQRSIDAMGGRKAFEVIRSAHTLAEVVSPLGQMTLDMSWMAPNKVLVRQISADSGGGIMGSDGMVTWVKGSMGYEIQPNEQAKQIQQQASLFLLVHRIESEHVELKTLDLVRFDGRDCYKIVGKDREGIESAYYFDTEDYLLRGGEMAMPSPVGEQTQTNYFREWKPDGGIRYFTRMDVEQAKMTITLTITQVKFNTLDGSVFALPPEVEAMLKDRPTPATAPSKPTTAPASTDSDRRD